MNNYYSIKEERLVNCLVIVVVSIVMLFSDNSRNRNTASSNDNPGCGTRAVSYTHLDVYKRQLLSCLLSIF